MPYSHLTPLTPQEAGAILAAHLPDPPTELPSVSLVADSTAADFAAGAYLRSTPPRTRLHNGPRPYILAWLTTPLTPSVQLKQLRHHSWCSHAATGRLPRSTLRRRAPHDAYLVERVVWTSAAQEAFTLLVEETLNPAESAGITSADNVIAL